MANLIRKDKFIFVEANENHNKVWYIEEYDNSSIKTIWGRVGNNLTESEKSFSSQYETTKEYDKLVKSKTKKGYTPLKVIDSGHNENQSISKSTLFDIAKRDIIFDHSSINIESMIKQFCEENIHNITSNTNITYNIDTNLFSTPVGIVTLEAVNEARDILNKIYDLVKNDDFNQDFIKYTEHYCSLIPQKVHGRFECNKIFPDLSAVSKQNDVLDSLIDSINASKDIDKSVENNDKIFNASISIVDDNKIIDNLIGLFQSTHNNIHACRNLKIHNVYNIIVDSMKTNYEQTISDWNKSNKTLNQKLLWHGTKKHNIISILRNGLIVPSASASYCTGRLFGNGIYLSDQSTKSLNYSFGYWDGNRDSHCYMFLCDVLMGKEYTPNSYGCSKTPKGYDSIFAKAGISGVQNNEMIVKPNQVNLKYLIEFI